MVWSLSLIITVFFLSLGTGMVVGGALKVLGQGLRIGGTALASNAGESGQDNFKRAADQVNSFADEAIQSGQSNSSPVEIIRAKREIGLAVAKVFAPGNDVNSAPARDQLKNVLVQYGKMSSDDAQKTIDEWTRSYNQLKDETKAVAERAARGLSRAGLWTFVALLVGLIVAAAAGCIGAGYSIRHPESAEAVGFPHDGNGTGRAIRPAEPQTLRSNP